VKKKKGITTDRWWPFEFEHDLDTRSLTAGLIVYRHELTVVPFQQSEMFILDNSSQQAVRSDAIRTEMVLNPSVLFYARQELTQRPGEEVVLAGWITEERVRETVLLYLSTIARLAAVDKMN
jgi:hypothetical protein